MIVLAASAEGDRRAVTEAARDAITSLGGTVTEVQHLGRESCTLHFELSAFGLPALGAFLGASGLVLDPASDVAIGGWSAGVQVNRVRGQLHVRFGANVDVAEPDDLAG